LNYKISLTDEAGAYLRSLDDKTKKAIARKIESLRESPDKRGKALTGNLLGYRSLHAAGRYRILYEVKSETVTVIVIGIGIRKEGSKIDVYETMKKMIKLRLLDSTTKGQGSRGKVQGQRNKSKK
jgi:mRNA interferase RelE/StbE